MSVEKLELETLSSEDEDDKGDSQPDVSETKFSNSHVDWYKRELHSSVSLPSGDHNILFMNTHTMKHWKCLPVSFNSIHTSPGSLNNQAKFENPLLYTVDLEKYNILQVTPQLTCICASGLFLRELQANYSI